MEAATGQNEDEAAATGTKTVASDQEPETGQNEDEDKAVAPGTETVASDKEPETGQNEDEDKAVAPGTETVASDKEPETGQNEDEDKAAAPGTETVASDRPLSRMKTVQLEGADLLDDDDIFNFFGFDDEYDSNLDIAYYGDDYGQPGPYGPYYEEITLKHLKEIAYELGLIQLSWPEKITPDYEEKKHYPASYTENNSKEKLLLLYTENFRQQFHFTYPDRKPLLLAADNECGLQKMVCTTIRPTRLHYSEFATWESCAQFIADYLEYEPLDKPTLFPERVWSPTSVLERQKANCFEFSTVLCSYLIGVGYTAYVVSGYASREFCFADQGRYDNPHLDKYKPKPVVIEETKELKYQVKPAKDFVSTYLLDMMARVIEINEQDRKEAEEEAKNLLYDQLYSIPPDELFALRVHSWVLILPGTHDITQPFFIEPATGQRHEIDDPNYLGLESLWDDSNYWVNLQDCSEGCKNLKFDLRDNACWTWLLLGEPWYMRTDIEDLADELLMFIDEKEDEEDENKDPVAGLRYIVEKHLDMPASWVSKLDIPLNLYKHRYPNGQKKVMFKQSKVEYYAPYIQRDGLVRRISTYVDYDFEEKSRVYETYENRADLLTETIQDFQEETVVEQFDQGREEGLKEHSHFLALRSVEDKRKLEFYPEARHDGLWMLEMDPLYITLHYKYREDRLFYRHAVFQPRTKGPIEDKRVVLSLVEKFERDSEKHADNDIAERTFLPLENRILLKYHFGNNNVIASTREFTKPPPEELGERLQFKPEQTIGFNIDPNAPAPKKVELFCLLSEQIAAEEESLFDLRQLEEEIGFLLKQRSVEAAVPKLMVSIYDTERNEEAKKEMAEQEKIMREQISKDQELEVDHLAPYLARLGTSVLTPSEARKIRDQCIADFKQLMVDRANYIQGMFEKGGQLLQAKHRWFEEEQENLTKEEEEEYYEYSNNMIFYLHTLELRMNRHRDLAPQRFMALESFLQNHPCLAALQFITN